MRNGRYVVLALPAMPASASGREGEALVEPIRWIVVVALITFVTLVIGGGVLGGLRASRAGESILKGSARGLVKGTVAFLVVAAVSAVIVWILSFLWFAYAYLHADALRPS